MGHIQLQDRDRGLMITKLLSGMETPSTYGENVKATFGEEWERTPIMSMYRHQQLSDARGEIPEYDPEIDWPLTEQEYYNEWQGDIEKTNPTMSQKDWKESEFFHPDIKWHEGMRTEEAKILRDLKVAERERQDIRRRADLNLAQKASLFGVALAAQALDPINIAVSFVPVFGQTRFAALVAKVGITKARAARGLVEGLVGAGIVEPVVYMSAQEQQADYNHFDSLMAVGMGAIFGSGLQSGFGKIGDILGISPHARDKMNKTVFDQVVDDRLPKVDGIVKRDGGDPLLKTDLDLPPKTFMDEQTVKEYDEMLGAAPTDEIGVRAYNDFITDTEELFQMHQRGVIDSEDYGRWNQELETIKKENESFSEAMEVLENCLMR